MAIRPLSLRRGIIITMVAGVILPATGAAQRRPARPQPQVSVPRAPSPAPVAQASSAPVSVSPDEVPTEAMLGVPFYPNAVYLTSYDAGQGQRYYIFGANATFNDMVQYYAVVLDERGDRVFSAPPVHVFETGRFREERMAFPPSVTIKDYTWNGSEGYLNPTSGASDRYPTIIQIVPPPAGEQR